MTTQMLRFQCDGNKYTLCQRKGRPPHPITHVTTEYPSRDHHVRRGVLHDNDNDRQCSAKGEGVTSWEARKAVVDDQADAPLSV